MDRKQFLRIIGPFPKKVPLRAKVIERQDCGSYVREKVEYSVEAHERVRAYILIPKNLHPKTAAIYCHHQHNDNFDLGKSEVVGLGGDRNQRYAQELAERGFITFAPDAIAFEERNWNPKQGEAEYFELATRLVLGKTLLAKVLHDVSVGLDYIRSRKEVDRHQIGFIGHSYGGRMAIWAPAFDKRIKVSVSHCGCINYKDSLQRDIGIQMEFCVPGIMEIGDIEDVVRLVEPSSLLISATDDDKWSKGATNVYTYAKSAFKRGDLELMVYPGKHIFTLAMRKYAYQFLEKHLESNKKQ